MEQRRSFPTSRVTVFTHSVYITHRKTRTNIHALGGIQPHDPSKQAAKTGADRNFLKNNEGQTKVRKYGEEYIKSTSRRKSGQTSP
jgi:hypothetical protein